jgi:chemotaxis protein CheD
MNHYLLPLWNGEGLSSPKYGNIAIQKLVDLMLENGSALQNIQAKVFGGADVLNSQKNHFQIGYRNILQAKEILKEYGIPIIAESVGGNKGRKILFLPHLGEVRLKYLEKHNI